MKDLQDIKRLHGIKKTEAEYALDVALFLQNPASFIKKHQQIPNSAYWNYPSIFNYETLAWTHLATQITQEANKTEDKDLLQITHFSAYLLNNNDETTVKIRQDIFLEAFDMLIHYSSSLITVEDFTQQWNNDEHNKSFKRITQLPFITKKSVIKEYARSLAGSPQPKSKKQRIKPTDK